MNSLNFVSQFPDEQSCRLKFKEYRDKQGVFCRHCGHTSHYWLGNKWQYECKECRHRQTLRSNTIMHGSQLPFQYWFIAMHLQTSTRKSFSALEIQRQLGHKYYEPIWAMVHKIRSAMGDRDSDYTLSGTIELDEGFFTTPVTQEHKEEPLKRGRGSQRKTTVMVMAESEPVPQDEQKEGKRHKPRKVGHIKMVVIEDLKAETVDQQVKEHVDGGTTVDSDNSTSYANMEQNVGQHRPKVIPKAEIGKALPWVHIDISNAKRLFLDVFHDISAKYLQNYLNEFCYKFNRRYFGEHLFDRVMVAAVSSRNQFRNRIR